MASGLTRAQLLRTASSLALAAPASLALAACGGAGGEGTDAAAISAKPVSLVLNTSWIAPGVRGQVVEEGLAEYKQRFPQVSVTIAPLGGDNPTLQVLMASDSVGDVAEWDHKLIVYFAKRNQIRDLRPYLKTFKYSMEDIYYIPEVCYYEGKLLGVPFQLNLFDWLYNKTLFKQMGVEPPSDNLTWEQFIALAKRLTNSSKDVWGTEWQITTGKPDNWLTPIRANGGTLLNPAFTKTTLNEPAALEAIGLIMDVIHKDQVAPPRLMANDKKYAFAAGNYAMSFLQYGRNLDKQMADAGGMEWDFFYSPIMPRSKKRGVLANMSPMVVPVSKRTNVDQAAQLTFFLGGEFVMGRVADLGAASPTFKKLIDSDRFLPASHRRKIVLDGHAYRPGYGSNFEQYVPWRAAVEAEFFKGWDGQQSAKATADNATAAGDASLAANGVAVAK